MSEKKTIHKIQHNKQREVLVPFFAIEKNIQFLLDGGGKVEFSDGATGVASDVKEVHILSDEANNLIQSIYGKNYTNVAFLKSWYGRIGEQLQSLVFVYFSVKWDD